jgi:hypothetical protein
MNLVWKSEDWPGQWQCEIATQGDVTFRVWSPLDSPHVRCQWVWDDGMTRTSGHADDIETAKRDVVDSYMASKETQS